MRVLSLFAGAGGFDLGLERAGMTTVGQVEWDRHCQSVLRNHWPDVPKWGDVQDCRASEMPDCDLIAFGSPCQDLSVAGKRAGLGGSRSSMFFEATRLIREYQDDGRPATWAVWENVAGALTSNGGRDFGAVLDDLADCGAVDVQWRVLDAQWFGVAQQRRRVFLVARFDPRAVGAEQVLPLGSGSRRNPLEGTAAGQDAAGPDRHGAPHDGGAEPQGGRVSGVGGVYPTGDLIEGRLPPGADCVIGTISGWYTGGTGNMQVDCGFVQPMIVDGELDDELLRLARSLKVPVPDDATQAEVDALPLVVEAPDPREDWTPPLMLARKLTPREAERLMDWPDDWTRWTDDGQEVPDSARYKMCGNGVVPAVAKWVGLQIQAAQSDLF